MNKTAIRKVLHTIEHVALVIILLATMVAIAQELLVMLENRVVRLSDLLLLFIYLEVIAMVGIYYEEHQLPVRYPLYIAMVALARYLILDWCNHPAACRRGAGAPVRSLQVSV